MSNLIKYLSKRDSTKPIIKQKHEGRGLLSHRLIPLIHRPAPVILHSQISYFMTRKGRLEEIFSKALYADDATLYSVSYRDFESVIEVPLQEFLKLSENFTLIPTNRILLVKKNGQVLYQKYGY